MLFKCLPPGAEPLAGRFPGPVHARGKWFSIDIHCHVRCAKAAAMVEGNAAVSRWFLETATNDKSRAINRQNGERTRLQGSSPEKRIEDMDRMGIDIQAISPAPRQTYYGADPDLGLQTARILNDEPFGPVAAMTRVPNLDAAIAEANRLPYGLAAYAFTQDLSESIELANRVESGMIGINQFTVALAEMPFGGIKESGYGSEGGIEGLEAYTVPKTVTMV